MKDLANYLGSTHMLSLFLRNILRLFSPLVMIATPASRDITDGRRYLGEMNLKIAYNYAKLE